MNVVNHAILAATTGNGSACGRKEGIAEAFRVGVAKESGHALGGQVAQTAAIAQGHALASLFGGKAFRACFTLRDTAGPHAVLRLANVAQDLALDIGPKAVEDVVDAVATVSVVVPKFAGFVVASDVGRV